MIGWSLAAVSVACGLAITLVFSRVTNLEALRKARKQIYAHLLEIRLYSAEPRLVWRAQVSLVRANLRLLAALAMPVLILTPPMAWLWLQFESIYGLAPLPVGQAAIVTAQMRVPVAEDRKPALEAPREIAVETLPVRSFVDRQVSWRLRPNEPVSGALQLSFNGHRFEKAVDAGTRGVYLLERKSGSRLEQLLRPGEGRLPAGDVEWIELHYPAIDVTIAGLSLPWAAWFLIISTASALVFARWLRVPL
jgi:hypothetical protein